MSMSEHPNVSPELDLEDVQDKFEEGCAALKADEYDTAVRLLGEVLEARVNHFGEMSPLCSSAYLQYGRALFAKAQAETDVLGASAEAVSNQRRERANQDEQLQENQEASVVDKATEGNGEGCLGEENEEGEKDEELDGDGQEENGDEAAIDEDESDLELAWKMLEAARLIHERQAGHSLEEADVITTLGDISLEKEDFATCIEDYSRALTLLEGLVERDDRYIAELCFKISCAHQLAERPKEALDFCQRAIAVCQQRVERLKRAQAVHGNGNGHHHANGHDKGKGILTMDDSSSPASAGGRGGGGGREGGREGQVDGDGDAGAAAAAEGGGGLHDDEIEEMEELIADLKDKEEELQTQSSGPSLLQALEAESPALASGLQGLRDAFSLANSLQPSTAPVEDPVNLATAFAAPNARLEPVQAAPVSVGTSSLSPFDAPQVAVGSFATSSVQNLGVVGRGVKRVAPAAVDGGLTDGAGQDAKRLDSEKKS
eukprot:jgi/Mesen1/10708/ME000090S10164